MRGATPLRLYALIALTETSSHTPGNSYIPFRIKIKTSLEMDGFLFSLSNFRINKSNFVLLTNAVY